MRRLPITVVAFLLPAVIAAAMATAQDAEGPPTQPAANATAPADAAPPAVVLPPAGEAASPLPTTLGVREVMPELYYMQDDAGRLVPVPGFRYRDFVEMFRIKEGLAGPALPPAAVLEGVTVRIDALELVARGGSCPAEVECVVRQSRGGWASVPLDLRGLLLGEPPRHEGPGRMLVDAAPDGGGYRAWFEPPASGGDDVRHTVVLTGRVPVEAGDRQDSFDLWLPVAIASRVEIRSRRQEPVVVTRPEAAGRIEVTAADEGSLVTVTGLTGEVRIRLAKPAADTGIATAATEAVCDSTVRIDGRTARITAVLRLANVPVGVDRITVALPPRTTLERVGGDATLVKRGGTAEKPVAEVAIERSRDGGAAIELDCERPIDPSGNTPLEPLGFAVAGIEPWRQSGRVSLVIEGDWQASWEDGVGLRRIDPPVSERVAGFVAAFAYDIQPASMPVRVRPRRSRVLIEPEYRYDVSTSRITLTARLRVAARGAPVGGISVAIAPEWVVDDIGPPTVVDAAALRIEGERVTLPFVQPLSGDAVVELRATRQIDPNADRVAWTMPVPQADLVGPAAVVISADSDIELLPDAEAIAGLVRQTASAVQPGDAERISLVYRLDAAEGGFAATRRFLARRVEANVVVRVSVEEREIAADQILRLNVLHVPLEFLELTVPESLSAAGLLEVRQGDELLEVVEVAGTPEPDTSGVLLKLVRAVLPVPLLGGGEVNIRYRIPTPDVPAETTAAADLPIPLPVVTGGGRQSVIVEETGRLAVTVRGDTWRRDVAGQSASAGRSWSVGKPQHILPLAISARLGEVASVTVIEATWLQTRLFPEAREDIATYVVSGPGGLLEIQLPRAPGDEKAAAVEVRIDGRPMPGAVRGDGLLVVELPDGGGSRRLVEIRSAAAWGGTAAGFGLPWPLKLDSPSFAADVLERRFYQEVLVSAEDHVLGAPARWTSQQAWTWQGFMWHQTATASQADLAAWVSTAWGRDESPPAGFLAGEPSLRQSRFLYAGIGSPGQAAVWVVPTWCLVLVASGATLAIGLALVYQPLWRHPGVILGLFAGAALLAAASPLLATLVCQAAVPGGIMAAMAAGLRLLLERPAESRRTVVPGSASSMTRTAPPTVSLIVASASESASGSATAVGRGGS